MSTQVIIQAKSVREQIRENRRSIEKSIRNIEREMKRVEAEERKMKIEIKKMAINKQLKAAKMLVRDIVRMRNQLNKMNEFCGQLKAVSLRIGSLSSLNEMFNALEEAAKAIKIVNANLDTKKLTNISKVIREYAEIDMKQDMMQGILEGKDDPVQQDILYRQVLKELNINIEGEVGLIAIIL